MRLMKPKLLFGFCIIIGEGYFFPATMHSQYRLSNSGDSLNLDVGVPGIQKIASDRNYSEYRYNIEEKESERN